MARGGTGTSAGALSTASWPRRSWDGSPGPPFETGFGPRWSGTGSREPAVCLVRGIIDGRRFTLAATGMARNPNDAMSGYDSIDPSALGPNMWLIDEMYRRYRGDPDSVDERWKDFFEDFQPRTGGLVTGATVAPPEEEKAAATGRPEKGPSVSEGLSQATGAPKPRAPKPTVPEGAERIRFGAERVVQNMRSSLEVPTATSFRFIPAKLLEENRRVANRFLAAGGGGKVSFTHLIGYAVLRALEDVPVMKSGFMEVAGEPYMVRHESVNL